MPDVIDVHNLKEDDAKFIEKIVNLLRENKGEEPKAEQEDIIFSSWPLGTKGTLSREEIYDHL